MQIVVRAAILFAFIWIALRVMGRKELAELSPFDLVVLIVMGDLIQQGVTQQDNSVTGAITAVSTFVLLTLVFSFLAFKSKRARNILDGVPVVIVDRGRLVREIIEIERLTDDDVKEAARQQGIADIGEIRLGVLEADGKFSFVRFDEARPQLVPRVEI